MADSQNGLPASSWKWQHTATLFAIVVVLTWIALVQPWGLLPSWVVVILALLAFILITGVGVTGVWRGALIDERNMISLSRFQMLIWTVLMLSSYGTVAMARLSQDPLSALDVGVPETLWLLMGISTTSLVASPLIKGTKRDSGRPSAPVGTDEVALNSQRDDLANSVTVDGQIVSKKSMMEASWSDLFNGEEVSNVARLDLAKIQMFFFTLLVVISYGAAVAASLRAEEIPASLPDLGEGMLTLIGISHGGYLANKAVPTAKR